jgi:SAM-dependent methyltransferase
MTAVSENLAAVDEIKRRARATWAAGDYDAAVDNIWAAGGVVTVAAGVRAGDDVLDVACGTGNAAVQAAQAGGRVTGVDLTPELFPAARRRAAAAGVEVELIEGDAEALPFDDGSFDVVLSTFGVMFAPRHAVTANEIVRVLRHEGRIAVASWEPDGSVGEMFRTIAAHLPPPPPIAEPPLLWGTEEHVRDLFDGGLELEFTHHRIPPNDGDPSELADRFIGSFPTLVTARALLEPQGLWEAAETDARRAVEKLYIEPPTYLVVSGVNR